MNFGRNPILFGEDEFESYLSLVLTTISIVSILITLLTYSLFSELRNLPGLNLMALCITLLAYQVLMIMILVTCPQLFSGFNLFKVLFLSTNNVKVISNRVACKVSAILIHFCVLSSFFWTSVMAWDIYKTFGRRNIFSRVRGAIQ